MEKVEKLLTQCAEIIKAYEKKIDDEAGRFNIFNILNVESKEVRLHSRFIAELLNIKGAHQMGTFFLDEFLKKLRTATPNLTFNHSKYTVAVEEYIGAINNDYTKGGRIDILLVDQDDNCIVVENKIYAGDQVNQLMRYEDYIQANHRNGYIIYLTLDGTSANENIGHISISYKDFIVDWLKKCMELIENDQVISHIKSSKIKVTINQYIEIITNYLIPSNQNEMTDQIESILRENNEYLELIPQINQVFKMILDKALEDYKNDLEKLSNDKKYSINYKNIEYRLNIDFDEYEFWFGYNLKKFSKSELKYIQKTIEEKELALFINNNSVIFTHGDDNVYLNNTFENLLETSNTQQKGIVFELINDSSRKAFIDNKLVPQLLMFKKDVEIVLNNLS